MTGGASLSAASSGDNSVSTALSSGFAASAALSGFARGFDSEALPSDLLRAPFLSPFLSDDLSDLSAAGSRIATRSSNPSMTTMASGFSVARMPFAAATQSAGSP